MNCICGRSIEQERIQLSLRVCKVCAHSGRGQSNRKGIMIYGHKTAGECQIVSEDNFKDYRRLNPYGKYSGRGSGVHVVSPKAK
jgi:hypothetical protein